MELLNPLSSKEFPAQSAAYGAAAGSTIDWNAGPEGVMVWSDQPCYIEVGEAVVATTASTPIPAYTPIPFKVPIGTSGLWRVSAIQISAAGTVYCKPMNTK
ncbi:MAG: hypothetical protein ACRC8I_09465 [Plesiomonas shigelloides]